MTSVVALARKAIGLLDKPNGWGRRTFCRRGTDGRDQTCFSYCLLGAVMSADGCRFYAETGHVIDERYKPSDAAIVLVNELARVTRHPFPHTWNDEPTRTKAEVIAALEMASARFAA